MSDIRIENYTNESLDEFLERKISRKRQACLLGIRNSQFKDCENLYKTTILIFESKHPNYQTFVSHGVREIINEITRDYKDQITEKCEVENCRVKITKGNTEQEKFQQFLKIHTPTTRDINHFSTQLFGTKKKLFSSVHQALKNLPNEEYDQYFFEFENILHDIFASSFIDRKNDIEILMCSTPTLENASKIQKHFHYRGIQYYFFSKLTNPEWIGPLIEKKLIAIPVAQTGENGNYVRIFWNESTYLKKIAHQKPDQVFQVIKDFLQQVKNKKEANQNINSHDQEIFNQILEIGKNFLPENFDYKKQIGEAFKNWIKKSDLGDFVNIKNIKEFLKDLFFCNQEKLALDILKEILKLKFVKKEYGEEFKAKFTRDGGMDNYYYEEILKIFSDDKILNLQNAHQIFTCLYCVLKTAIFTNNEEFTAQKIDEKFCWRSAIEDDKQDQYKRSSDYRLVSAIRDVAEYIFKNDLDADGVINKLSEKSGDYEALIITRIILHLLREFPENRKHLFSKYLASENCFRNNTIHHEYYLLLRQEFGNLNKEDQKIILGFIDEGSPWKKDGIDPDEYQKFQDRFRYDELHCIKDNLFGKWKDDYQELGKCFKETENPEFLYYMSDGFDGNKSPIKPEEIAGKNIDEIIQYLKEWKPKENDSWNGASISGLADEVKKDAEKKPRKYLDDLEKFKDVEEPAYISHLFRGLAKFNEKTLDDWQKIIDLGKIIAGKDVGEIVVEKQRSSFDRENSWDQPKRELVTIFTETFKNKEIEKTLSIDLANDVFDILSKITLQEDFYLEQKEVNDNDDDRYYIRAINSCHGEAFSALIEYGLWLRRNKREEQASKQIIPILDDLIKTSKYQETWSVMGRYLPWIMFIGEEWIKNNIDKILPENDRQKFDPAWLTYVNFVNPYDLVFELIKGKYLYVLENNLYKKDIEKVSNSGIPRHIINLYARGKIGLEDKIITALFEDKNIFEAKEVMRFVGTIVKNEKGLPETVINRFQELWNWYINNIKNHHPKILQGFFLWYGSGKFDREWAIDNFIKILKQNPDLKIRFFDLEDQMVKDIPDFVDKITTVIDQIIFSDYYPFDGILVFTKSYFSYIENHGNDLSKKSAEELKNKFCEKYNFDENLDRLIK
jgi:hypothetical protein